MKIFVCSLTSNSYLNPTFSMAATLLSKDHAVFHYQHDPKTANSHYNFMTIIEEIQKADIFVAEMSQSSQTLGFQLAHALQLSKPSLYLYDATLKEKPKGVIGNIPSRGLRFRGYDESNYKKVINDFIKFAEKQMLTKRTSFMSTQEIDKFLSIESQKRNVSKGELIRQLIHKSINP